MVSAEEIQDTIVRTFNLDVSVDPNSQAASREVVPRIP
jgi:hypothetical protein